MTTAITDAELVLMRLLWKESPLTAREITQRLDSDRGWHRKTVNTLLSRLSRKEAVLAEQNADGVQAFSPLLEEQSFKQSVTSQFVDDLFDGDIAPLVASFTSSRTLDAGQLEQLRRILRDIDDPD